MVWQADKVMRATEAYIERISEAMRQLRRAFYDIRSRMPQYQSHRDQKHADNINLLMYLDIEYQT